MNLFNKKKEQQEVIQKAPEEKSMLKKNQKGNIELIFSPIIQPL